MVKYLLLLVNLLVVLISQLFLDENVSVKQTFSDRLAPGESMVVTLEISKDDVAGFGYLQQDIPAGFAATPLETKNASFTFHKGNLKFMWYTLPAEETFSVSYKLTAPANASGSYSIAGVFSYLVENDKKTAPIPARSFQVNGGSDPVASLTTQTKNSRNKDEVSCKRTVDLSRLRDYREIVVSIELHKGAISGFAKVLETMPEGFVPTAIESGTSTFSFVDQQARFFWMALPATDVINLQYKIKVDENLSGTYYLNGDFSYLIDNHTSKCVFAREEINLSEAMATAEPESEPEPENDPDSYRDEQPEPQPIDEPVVVVQPDPEPTPKPEPEPVVVTQPAPQTEPSKVTKPEPTKQAVVPVPATGIQFKVQIAATQKPVDPVYFKTRFKVADKIDAEMHEGWNKYTIGGYATYRQARDKREAANASYPGLRRPFVTAYNQGTRITVQEALMISNQKWVK